MKEVYLSPKKLNRPVFIYGFLVQITLKIILLEKNSSDLLKSLVSLIICMLLKQSLDIAASVSFGDFYLFLLARLLLGSGRLNGLLNTAAGL